LIKHSKSKKSNNDDHETNSFFFKRNKTINKIKEEKS